jgi:hypothetical protein
MIKTTRYLILAALIGLVTAPASQAGSYSLVGVGDYANQNPSVTSKLGLGGGILFDDFVTRGVQFEFGALYLTRKFDSGGGSSDSLELTYHEIQVPVLLKFRLLPLFHIGVGGYWATAVGSVDDEDSTSPSKSNSSESISDAGMKSIDYGLLGTAGFALPLGRGGTHFLIDARYAYGLANVSNSGTTNNRDIEILAGFSFSFGRGR